MTHTADVATDLATIGHGGPWSWRPETGSWAARLTERAVGWAPSISADVPGLGPALGDACDHDAAWLCHPSSGALTHDEPRGRAERDLGFIAWTALHTALEGRIELDRPRWCWSPSGGFPLAPGIHDLRELTLQMADAPTGRALDPWCTSLGYPAADTCVATITDEAQQASTIERSVLVTLRSQAYGVAAAPSMAAWVDSLVDVVIPLDGSSPYGRSASRADLPGLVFLDTMSEIAVLELLVHEAAHHLLYLTEAAGPLLDPDDDRVFESPLRPDARPLRGILLAYHALAFICALYHDLDTSTIFHGALDGDDIADLRSKRDAAGATLHSVASSLTDDGIEFLRRTDEVADHVR